MPPFCLVYGVLSGLTAAKCYDVLYDAFLFIMRGYFQVRQLPSITLHCMIPFCLLWGGTFRFDSCQVLRCIVWYLSVYYEGVLSGLTAAKYYAALYDTFLFIMRGYFQVWQLPSITLHCMIPFCLLWGGTFRFDSCQVLRCIVWYLSVYYEGVLSGLTAAKYYAALCDTFLFIMRGYFQVWQLPSITLHCVIPFCLLWGGTFRFDSCQVLRCIVWDLSVYCEGVLSGLTAAKYYAALCETFLFIMRGYFQVRQLPSITLHCVIPFCLLWGGTFRFDSCQVLRCIVWYLSVYYEGVLSGLTAAKYYAALCDTFLFIMRGYFQVWQLPSITLHCVIPFCLLWGGTFRFDSCQVLRCIVWYLSVYCEGVLSGLTAAKYYAALCDTFLFIVRGYFQVWQLPSITLHCMIPFCLLWGGTFRFDSCQVLRCIVWYLSVYYEGVLSGSTAAKYYAALYDTFLFIVRGYFQVRQLPSITLHCMIPFCLLWGGTFRFDSCQVLRCIVWYLSVYYEGVLSGLTAAKYYAALYDTFLSIMRGYFQVWQLPSITLHCVIPFCLLWGGTFRFDSCQVLRCIVWDLSVYYEGVLSGLTAAKYYAALCDTFLFIMRGYFQVWRWLHSGGTSTGCVLWAFHHQWLLPVPVSWSYHQGQWQVQGRNVSFRPFGPWW